MGYPKKERFLCKTQRKSMIQEYPYFRTGQSTNPPNMLGDTIDGKAQFQDLFQDLGTILCTLAGILVVIWWLS